MADIIPFVHPVSPWAEKLAEFDTSGDALVYLDAFEMALVNKARLDDFQERHGEFLNACDNSMWFDIFARSCRILARIEWPPAACTPPTISVEFKKAMTALNNNAVMSEAVKTKANAQGMGRFPSGFRFVDALDNLYGNDNPLDYINKTIGILSPEQTYRHVDECWFSDEESIRPNKQQLDFLVSKVIGSLISRANQGQNSKSGLATEDLSVLKRERLITIAPMLTRFFLEDLDAFAKTLTFEANTAHNTASGTSPLKSYDDLLMYLLQPGRLPIPQGMLMAIVRKILNTGFDPGDRNVELAAQAGLHMISWPIGAPTENWSEIQSGLHDADWAVNLQACYAKPQDVPFLPCGMLTSGLGVFYGSTIDFRDVLGDETYSLALQRYSDKLTRLSIRELDGKFPWQPWESTANWYAYLNCCPASSWNLLLHFQALQEEGVTLDFFDSEFYGHGNDYYGDDEYNHFVGFNTYKTFWLAAEREGLYKLGNAVFAFYLVRKIITCRELNSPPRYDWPAFVEQIERCMAHPGSHWVNKALVISRQICEEKGWGMVWLRLDSLLGITDMPIDLSSAAKSDDTVIDLGMEAERALAEKYGMLLDRLHDRSRRMLCKAEANYVRHSKNLGLNSNEYGSESIDYAKCFENELDRRLQDIYLGDQAQLFMAGQIRGWKNYGEPTLGTYIKFLERWKEMPDDLLAIIQSKIGTLGEDGSVLGKLRKIQKVRNRGAHPGEDVSASGFTELRELIHSGGLLRCFLEHLPVCARCY